MTKQTAEQIKIVCSHCGSGNVRRDAYASWDIEKQEWILASVFEQGYCEKCGGEAILDEQRLQGCQHQEHEDCMTCVDCGECREDLDDDDICGDCRGE